MSAIGAYSALISTCERRCQLYSCWRAIGSSSTDASAKPRLRNQCAVRVVSTNSRRRLRRGRALDAADQPLAVTVILIVGVHAHGRHLRHAGVGKRVQRRAAVDDAIVLEHREALDFALDQLARALDQRAVGFQRLEQLQQPADVLDIGLAHRFEIRGRDHRAHAVMREQF